MQLICLVLQKLESYRPHHAQMREAALLADSLISAQERAQWRTALFLSPNRWV
jgi:hypothetical protein